MLLGIKKLHFIGIGGVGMSGIAEILHNLGFEITGSDLVRSEATHHLISIGIKVYCKHKKENINENVDVVVYSSAIKNSNPEIQEAKKRNIHIIKRAEMLAELMRIKKGIAIAGTHGKSSTTAICGKVFIDCKTKPTVIIGGRFDYIQGNAKLGTGDFLIAEADESDKTFLLLSPIINIITSIDNDHLNNYGNFENLLLCFTEFANKPPFFGFNILNNDDKNIRKIIPNIKTKNYTYGYKNKSDFFAENIVMNRSGSSFDVKKWDKYLGHFKIPYTGWHYISNTLSVIALASVLGLNIKTVKGSIASYSGLARRDEFMGNYNGALIYNDYGHHPTEIKATLSAFSKIKEKRLITVFQPHRYSRTKELLDDFATSFKDTDILFVANIYPASEKPIKGMNSQLLTDKIIETGKKNVFYIGRKNLKKLLDGLNLEKGDVVLFLGAGDYYLKGREILDED